MKIPPIIRYRAEGTMALAFVLMSHSVPLKRSRTGKSDDVVLRKCLQGDDSASSSPFQLTRCHTCRWSRFSPPR